MPVFGIRTSLCTPECMNSCFGKDKTDEFWKVIQILFISVLKQENATLNSFSLLPIWKIISGGYLK